MLRTISFYGFLLTILLAPLPLGSNRPLSMAVLAALIAFWMVVETFSHRASEKDAKTDLLRVLPAAVPFLLFCLWAAIQSFNFGSGSLLAHPIWQETEVLIGGSGQNSISVNPGNSLSALMLILAYGGAFWLALRYAKDSIKASIMLKGFVWASTLYAGYGLAVYFSGNGYILWMPKFAYLDDLTSTFVNRNNYATYAALGLFACLTALFHIIGKELSGHMRAKQLVRTFFNSTSQKATLPLIGVVLNLTALFLSHSRAGFAAMLIGLIVLLPLLSYIKLMPKKILLVCIGGFALMGISIFAISSGDTVARLKSTTLDNTIRDEVFQQTLNAISDHKASGTGYGSFEEVFPAYKSDHYLMAGSTWDKAHNTYLELFLEMGMLPTLCLLFAVGYIIFCQVRGIWKRRRRRHYAVFALAASLTAGSHALVDFSLQIPAFAVTFAMILGLGFAQSFSNRPKRRKE